MQMWGRNLSAGPRGQCTLTFQSGGGTAATATATADTPYHATFKAPEGLSIGRTYSVLVNNGLGGKLGRTAVETTLKAVKASDPLGLGCEWAADLAFLRAGDWKTAANTYNVKTDRRLTTHARGDGTSNDCAAMQAAINAASTNPAGGGIVYLPAGTYNIGPPVSGDYVVLGFKSHCILMGDGANTILQFDNNQLASPNGPMQSNYRFLEAFACKQFGMINLRVRSLNDKGHASLVITGASANQCSDVVFKRVDIDITGSQAAPVVQNNLFEVTSGAQGGDGSGEAILTQDSNIYGLWRDEGTSTGATSTTLVDDSKNWSGVVIVSASQNVNPTIGVKILSGPCAGQWRRVIEVTGTTLTVSPAWESIPPAGSTYATGPWGADRVYALGNTFKNPINSSIDFYSDGWYCTAAGNITTIDSDAAW